MKLNAKTKVSELIKSFAPCEVCGNNDIKMFRFKVDNGKSLVKCDECENMFPTPDVDNIIKQANDDRFARAHQIDFIR